MNLLRGVMALFSLNKKKSGEKYFAWSIAKDGVLGQGLVLVGGLCQT